MYSLQLLSHKLDTKINQSGGICWNSMISRLISLGIYIFYKDNLVFSKGPLKFFKFTLFTYEFVGRQEESIRKDFLHTYYHS